MMSFLLGKFSTPHLQGCVGGQYTLNFKEFYEGDLRAYGVARNCFGKVMRRFNATVKGACKDDKLILNEFFTYDDGRQFDRQWELVPLNQEGTKFVGKGADVLGPIEAETSGYAGFLRYTLKIPTKKGSFKTMKVTHWQYQIDQTHTLHFLKIKKFGFTVIQSTVMFIKL